VDSSSGPMKEGAVRRALESVDRRDVVAIVATAGTTNGGFVDELDGIADVCQERDIWLHIDAAYGGAALLSRRTRDLL